MSEAAPWRALEDDTMTAVAGPGGRSAIGGPDDGPATSSTDPLARVVASGRGGWIAATLIAASVIVGFAVWIVASGGQGSLLVEGAGPVPGRSGAVAAAGGTSPVPAARARFVLDVQGAVVRPGIVELAPGSRIADAIAAAGGFGPRVATDRVSQTLNLAALVKDGDQVIVPSRDDPQATAAAPGGGGSAGAGAGPDGPVDLNRATPAELDALPGIGPVTAAKIVAAREEQAFASVDELRSRKILGAATFDKVKDLVVVR